ncbi:DASH family cryptochrome [Pedobacter sp. BAL39]|uniref:DASH family cryptochrome n=1 Tax=Pedobacter sp. BAL39 TaxID=391596 RepID=UPI0003092512|nr:DASH family cryptochrome [Pedobacter sp. BAL39]
MKSKRILVWFRNDLRLHDNEMLVEAISKSDSILPVYFFDPYYFDPTQFNTVKTGMSRTKFLLESVAALRASFQQLGGDLLVLYGKPEELMAGLVDQYEISEVYHHREVAPEETQISTKVEDLLWKLKINLRHFIGHTLYNKEDLPFPIKDIPDVFAQFKKKTERDAMVKSCFLSPDHIEFVENEDWGQLPGLKDLGFEEETFPGEEDALRGGEEAGLQHLSDLLLEGAAVYQKYTAKQSAEREAFSSRLSGWLSLGCLSPRMVYWMVKEAESKFGSNANFNQMLLGLLWRDYYRFMFKKHGTRFFKEPDFESDFFSSVDPANSVLKKWKTADTGYPLIDNYMTELNDTGYISYTGRLVVATYLVHFLKVHWTNGAVYFEEKLIDYAPASNWGNWANVAGVGKDGKSKNGIDIDKLRKMLELSVSGETSVA